MLPTTSIFHIISRKCTEVIQSRLTDLPIASGNFPLTYIDLSRNQFKDPRIMEHWKKGTDHLCQFLEMRMDCAPKKKVQPQAAAGDQGVKLVKGSPALAPSKDTDKSAVKKMDLVKKDSDDIKKAKESAADQKSNSPNPMRIPNKPASSTGPLLSVPANSPSKSRSPGLSRPLKSEADILKATDSSLASPRANPSLQRTIPTQTNSEKMSLASPRTLPSLSRGLGEAQSNSEKLSIASPRTLPSHSKSQGDAAPLSLLSPRSAPNLMKEYAIHPPPHQVGSPVRGSPSPSIKLDPSTPQPRPSKLRFDAESPNTSPRTSDPPHSSSSSSSNSSAGNSPLVPPPQASANASPGVNADQVKSVLGVCKDSAASIMSCIAQVKVHLLIINILFYYHNY